MCRSPLVVVLVLAGCTGEIEDAAELQPGHAAPDAGLDPRPRPDAAPTPAPGGGVAPAGAVPGERPAQDGANGLTLGPSQAVLRIEAEPGEHVAFVLSCSGVAGATLSVDRWDGARPVEIGKTVAGPDKRFLSVRDVETRRTYWVRASATASGPATLIVTRTPFVDASHCASDCARLIQMPLPNDPAVDGYDTDGGTYFKYWFGRRDLVMIVRWMARKRAEAGDAPVFPYDFSQWDGETPGTDVGSPRHVSHQRGKDVDVSLYGEDGIAPWRSYCTTQATSDGRECIPGTRRNFDGRTNALLFGSALVSNRVTMSFLDRELIPALRDGAQQAAAAGDLDGALLPLYNDGKHVQHWPNHDNHIHVRVAETAYDAKLDWEEPFEAP